MKTISAIAFVLAGVSLQTSVEAVNLFADGGFESDTNTPCQASFEYKFENKSTVTLTGCVDIDDFPVYPFVGTSSSVNTNEPIDPRTTMTKYCATGPKYNAFNTNNRELWGYCLDKDLPIDALLSEGLYADGGYQSTPVKCVEGEWTYKEKVGATNVVTTLNGCVPIADFKPYPYYDNIVSEINALLEPISDLTDTSKWCLVPFDDRNVYNPTPTTESNKFQWGFCLEIKSDVVTESPTVHTTLAPTTKSPTTKSPTISVTSNPPTKSPTVKITTESPTLSDYEAYETVGPTTVPTPKPTVAGNKPTTSGDPNPGKSESKGDGSSPGMIAGVTIAVILVVVAVILAGLFAYSARNKSQNKKGNENEKKGDVEDNKPQTSGIF